ncbi:PucR family transcriptional regulator [Mycobacterium sp. NPDC003449]
MLLPARPDRHAVTTRFGEATARTRGVTVADVSALTHVPVVTTAADTSSVVAGVVDLGSTASEGDSRRHTPVRTDLALLRWEPPRSGGPLPDLTAVLSVVLQTRPAAVVVTPDRPVNPPRAAVELADRVEVPLLWDRDNVASMGVSVAELVDEDLGVPGRQDSGRVAADRDGFAVRVLAAAGDGQAVSAVLGETLGARVEFRVDGIPSGPVADAGSTRIRVAQRATLQIDRAPLGDDEQHLVDLVIPLLAVHAGLPDPAADDRSVEAARALKLILGEDLAQREQAIRRSRRLSLFTQQEVTFLAVEPFNISVDVAGLQRLRTDLASVAVRFDPHAVTVLSEGAAVVLVAAPVDMKALVRALCRAAGVPIALGTGDPVSDHRGYPGAFRQARRAVAVGRRIGAINRLTRYRDLGVLALLYQLPEHARRSFVSDTLGPIADSTPESLEQRRLLRVLRATDCNITESARRLYVHPNTLRTKISRIESITGPLLNDPEQRWTVFTALSMFSLDSNPEE